MSTLSHSVGILGSALLIASLWLRLQALVLPPGRWRLVGLVIALIISLVPFGDLSMAANLRGLVGDLSMASMLGLVLICIVYVSPVNLLDQRNRSVLLGLVLLAAAFLYPMTMGLTYFDPYELGYGSYGFALSVFVVAVLSWYLRAYVAASAILLAMVTYSVGLYESRNLWDYLVDPVISAYAVLWLLTLPLRKKRQQRQAQTGTNR